MNELLIYKVIYCNPILRLSIPESFFWEKISQNKMDKRISGQAEKRSNQNTSEKTKFRRSSSISIFCVFSLAPGV
jgi:hypothetical protein